MNIVLTVLRNPLFPFLIKAGLTDPLLDLYWGKNTKNEWIAIENTGFIKKPKSIWFEPTMRCNLNCVFCHQQKRRELQHKEMSLKQIDEFLTKARNWGINLIEMVGGEIFVRKDIFEILDLIEEKQMKVKLGTNGTLLNKKGRNRIKRYKCIESIAVSIDGRPETHNKLRNSSIAFQKAVESLRDLSQGKFLTGIYSLLFPGDTDTQRFLIELSKKLKTDRLTFMPEMFYSPEDIVKTRRYLSLLPEENIFVETKRLENIEEYSKKIVDSIKNIRDLRRKERVFASIFPRVSYKYPLEFLTNSLSQNKRLICRHFYSLTVIENGDVLICPFIHKKAGNVLEEDIEDIWNNKIIRQLRRKILKANMLPICKHCCSLDYII